MLESREIVLTIDSRLEDVALVGVAVKGICELLGFSAQERYNVELCVVEAASNSVRHAYRGEAGHPLTVRLSAFEDRIEVRVLDRGLPVPEEKRAPHNVEVDPADLRSMPDGGRGTFLIHTLMDRVEYGTEGGTNVLLMTKARPRR